VPDFLNLQNNSVERNLKTWNQRTLSSLEDQLAVAKDSPIKARLLNRINIANSNYAVNGKGTKHNLRYEFLKTIYTSKKSRTNYFIIETSTEGEVIQLRNYVIENDINSSHIEYYSYYQFKWKKVKDTTISRVDLKSMLNNGGCVINYKGNRNDVVLTEFSSHDIDSHYFLQYSLAQSSPIVQVLKIEE
jgi:hypothetical protein